MLDVLNESLSHPQPMKLGAYRRVLVLAAHPDDEVYGCGGLIALARRHGADVHVHIVTHGASDAADVATIQQRREESLRAAPILGHTVTFGNEADRSLRLEPSAVGTLQRLFELQRPDLILVPALNDYHPDHQALALRAVQALAGLPEPPDLAFYETIGTVDHPSHILDISAVYDLKRQAMLVFASQEAQLAYAAAIEARDRFRAMPLAPKASHAEVYALASCRQRGWTSLLPLLQSLYRLQQQAAAHPDDVGLVSVLIRTIGDPHLSLSVASALAQTYRPLEIVLVLAHGRPLEGSQAALAHLPQVRVIMPRQPLGRAAAANEALRHARGRWLIFLDDDDTWLPQHLHGLVQALHSRPNVLAACSAVQVTGEAEQPLRVFPGDSLPERMLATNQLPIHSVLFHRELVETHGCRFDENLPVLEDWDFWLQVQQYTHIARVPAITAIYRWRDRSGLFDRTINLSELRAKVHAKWHDRLGWGPYRSSLQWHAEALDRLEQQIQWMMHQLAEIGEEGGSSTLLQAKELEVHDDNSAFAGLVQRLCAQWRARRDQWQRLQEANTHLTEQYDRLLAVHAALEEQRVQLQEMLTALDRDLDHQRSQLHAILTSRSWRWTAPLRLVRAWIGRRLHTASNEGVGS